MMEKHPFTLHQNQPAHVKEGTHWLRVTVMYESLFCLRRWMLLQFHCYTGHCRGAVLPLIQLSNREMNCYDTEHLSAQDWNLALPYSGITEPFRVVFHLPLKTDRSGCPHRTPQPTPLLLTLQDKWKVSCYDKLLMGALSFGDVYRIPSWFTWLLCLSPRQFEQRPFGEKRYDGGDNITDCLNNGNIWTHRRNVKKVAQKYVITFVERKNKVDVSRHQTIC